MVKYSPEFKAQIVHECIVDGLGSRRVGAKYNIDSRRVREWVQRYKTCGEGALLPRREKRTFSAEFKLTVINYYQTHEESLVDVAAKYDVLPSQISIWRKAFLKDGYDALKPHRKGRKASVTKQAKNQPKKSTEKATEDQLQEELARLRQENYQLRRENCVIKKSVALFGNSKHGKKRS